MVNIGTKKRLRYLEGYARGLERIADSTAELDEEERIRREISVIRYMITIVDEHFDPLEEWDS